MKTVSSLLMVCGLLAKPGGLSPSSESSGTQTMKHNLTLLSIALAALSLSATMTCAAPPPEKSRTR